MDIPKRVDSKVLLLGVALGLGSAACNIASGVDDLIVQIGPGAGGGGEGGSPSTTGGGSGTTAATSTSTSTTASGSASSSSASSGSASSSSTTTSASSSSTSSTSSTSSGSSGGGGDPLEAAAQACVDAINAYRVTLGLTPYERWNPAEDCAGTEAGKDSQSGKAHSAFGQCGEWAQNECPGWPGPPDQMIGGCLQMMWNEGPGDFSSGHGHYLNMSSTQYSKVACGFHVLPDGSVWATQDFQ